MRIIYFFIVCALLAGCFYAGFELGRKDTGDRIVETAAPANAPEPGAGPTEAPVPDGPNGEDSAPKAMEPSEPTEAEWARYELEARAARGVVDLTDQQGRTIRAMILNVGADAITVRRQVDFTVVKIPVDVLIEDDQLFAKFLWERRQSSEPKPAENEQETTLPADDMEISPELFDEIFGQ
jgi:hypothetical protein